MEKHIVDEKTGISYTLQGDYYIPDLTLPDEDKTIKIGIWGIRHKRYLMEHKKDVFTIMQMNGTLQPYLADINEQAEDMYIRLVKEMANAEGVTEQLKAENQMLWVQKMNNICNRVREIIDDVYQFLALYDIMYKNFTDAEKKIFLNQFLECVEIFKEQQPSGQILKSITFKFPVFYDGETISEICWDGIPNTETVVLLSRA